MNKQILLVDDDASLRTTLRACLEVAGFICAEAKDGHDARSWMEGGPPVDLIVTDHQMPRVPGLEFIKGLKSQKNTEDIPIIFYSGQLTADLKTHALQAGASAVLEKPFPLQEFLDLVAQICEKNMQ
jgi:CheY-like chemotaxis protein